MRGRLKCQSTNNVACLGRCRRNSTAGLREEGSVANDEVEGGESDEEVEEDTAAMAAWL